MLSIALLNLCLVSACVHLKDFEGNCSSQLLYIGVTDGSLNLLPIFWSLCQS